MSGRVSQAKVFGALAASFPVAYVVWQTQVRTGLYGMAPSVEPHPNNSFDAGCRACDSQVHLLGHPSPETGEGFFPSSAGGDMLGVHSLTVRNRRINSTSC